MKRLFVFATAVALSLVASGLLLAQSDPGVGIWKLNVAKSKFPGAEPKSETRTVEAQGNGAKYSFEGVAADGSRIAYSFTTNYGGKDSPISGAVPVNGADTIAVKIVSANTVTTAWKKAGKVVQTSSGVLSKDGKVMTWSTKGTDAQGQPVSATTVWDKL